MGNGESPLPRTADSSKGRPIIRMGQIAVFDNKLVLAIHKPQENPVEESTGFLKVN
jgi:hypothetical protein